MTGAVATCTPWLLWLQVDVMLEEVDELDADSLAFIYGRAAEPVQPQILRARLLAEGARFFVAVVDGRERVCAPQNDCLIEPPELAT